MPYSKHRVFALAKDFRLDENDLRAFGHVHEITGGYNVLHAVDEIFLLQTRTYPRTFCTRTVSRRHPKAFP